MLLRAALFILATTQELLPAFAANDNAGKKFQVANNMNLTDVVAKTFWPIYDACQKDLHQINERFAKVINDCTLAYNEGASLSDAAKKLLDEVIAVELTEVKLKQSFDKALPATKVARYTRFEPSYATDSQQGFTGGVSQGCST